MLRIALLVLICMPCISVGQNWPSPLDLHYFQIVNIIAGYAEPQHGADVMKTLFANGPGVHVQ